MSGGNEDYLSPIDCATFIKHFNAALGNLNCLYTKIAASIAFAKRTSNCVGPSSWKESASCIAKSPPFWTSLKHFLEFWAGTKDWFLTPLKQKLIHSVCSNFEQLEEDTVTFSLIPPKWRGSLVIRSELRKFLPFWAFRDGFAPKMTKMWAL
jgi:hypothetical protein